MKIFSSINTRLKDFKPLIDGEVGIYSCGPTVYNNPHIGNLSAFIYADTLRRSFEANGYKTKHVMNITDVEDKIIRDSKSLDDDPLVAMKILTNKYTKVFIDDLKATGNDTKKIEFISAVESIPEMIDMTQKLLDNSVAYIADDGVYFSLGAYRALGNMYGLFQKIEVSKTQSRISNDEYDKDVAGDFALWKKSKPGEPSWPAEFTDKGNTFSVPGRPGWHIECSVMAEKTLGTPFDIHTGGIDLKFPHHENEIAQTRGATGEKLTNYFVHTSHILVNGRKMAKSAGNFFTLRDIENKNFTPQAFRLLVLESHYRKENNFSWDILVSAQNRLANWQATSDLRWQLPESNENDVVKKMAAALANDMNTPKVLVLIDAYFDSVEKSSTSPNKEVLAAVKSFIGIDLLKKDIEDEIKKLLKKRVKARKDKEWEESDKLRDEILNKGYGINDSDSRQLWYRISAS